MNASWVLGIVSALVVIGIGGLFKTVLNHEKRLTTVETSHQSLKDSISRIEAWQTLFDSRLDKMFEALIELKVIIKKDL